MTLIDHGNPAVRRGAPRGIPPAAAVPDRPATRGRRGQRGAILLILAVAMLAVIGMAGLAIDAVRVGAVGVQLQTTADSSALAGALQVIVDDSAGFAETREVAARYATMNIVDSKVVHLRENAENTESGDIVVGLWDRGARTFTPTMESPNAVAVQVRRDGNVSDGPLDLAFGSLFGVRTIDASRRAIAVAEAADPRVLVLDPSMAGALSMHGNPTLTLDGGWVHANSTAGCAVDLAGAARIAAARTSACGGICASGDAITGEVETGAKFVADPLAGLLPDDSSWNSYRAGMARPLGANGSISGSGTYAPGYYPKGGKLTGHAKVVLQPGVYMFGGKGLDMVAQTELQGSGVTLLFDTGAGLKIGGGASMALTPPSSGMFQGLTIFIGRRNTGARALDLAGGGTLDVEGTVYVPEGEARLGGNAAKWSIGGFIVDRLELGGTPDYQVTGLNTVPPRTVTAHLVD